MPEVDVTDVLLDPDVAGQSFDVVRRPELVTAAGLSTTPNARTVRGVFGSVTPTGDNSLIRDEAYDAQAKTIDVVTQFRLRGPSATTGSSIYKPDVVLWNGDAYEVRVLEDDTQFGAGFVKAECIQIVYDGTPPHQEATQVGELDFSQNASAALAKGAP